MFESNFILNTTKTSVTKSRKTAQFESNVILNTTKTLTSGLRKLT